MNYCLQRFILRNGILIKRNAHYPVLLFLVAVLRFSTNKIVRIANYIDIILLIDHLHNAFYGTSRGFLHKEFRQKCIYMPKLHIHFQVDYAVGLCPILTTKLTTLWLKKSEFIGFFGTG